MGRETWACRVWRVGEPELEEYKFEADSEETVRAGIRMIESLLFEAPEALPRVDRVSVGRFSQRGTFIEYRSFGVPKGE